MIILDELQSNELRCQYVQHFIDSTSNYYVEKIENKKMFSDGLCYTGYLWDCLKNPQVISESKANQLLQEKEQIFIMWDIHSCDRIFIPNYWNFPKSRILYVNKWLNDFKSELPEDIYLFDDTFNWSIVYTHETDKDGFRYCVYLNNLTELFNTGDGSMIESK